MARNETVIEAPIEATFDVLADPHRYADWVLGSREVRDADRSWPSKGSILHHSQGLGPFTLVKDTASVVELERPRRIVLEARARPAVVARVELLLRPEGDRTHVTMLESPVGGIASWVNNPLLDALVWIRNSESLRRLRRLAERQPVRRRSARSAAR